MHQATRRVIFCVLLVFGVSVPGLKAAGATAWPIIVRRGDTLDEGGRPFRFFGLAAPNLHQNESQLLPDFHNRFPDEYEIRDVLLSLHQLGARATRSFTLSVIAPEDRGVPTYLTGRRAYNEEAFRALDCVLALCHEYDIRVIIPLIDSHAFSGWRGVDAFAALAGKSGADFWTNATVKADFRALIAQVVNRRNTVSGLRYRDDPAILAWQVGNELDSYASDRQLDPGVWLPRITAWTREMAAALKQADPNHLVMEGGGDRQAYLADPNVDVMSNHLYEYWNRHSGRPWNLAPLARRDRDLCRGRKPLMIDEFGLGSVDSLHRLMAEIRDDGIVGGLLWSIRGHRRDGGFFYHNEGGTAVNSYHWPGFATGDAYDERRVLELLRIEAYAIRGEAPPPLSRPSPAPILIRTGTAFTWRGSTGASSYTLERATAPGGPWQLLAGGLVDSTVVDVRAYEDQRRSAPEVLYVDADAPPGQHCWYRIKALNAAGETDYSNVVDCAAE